MKVVIDIPEEYYEALRETDVIIGGKRSGKTLESVIYDAVAKGTPLQKNHGRLIDAIMLKAEMFDLPQQAEGNYWDGVDDVGELIDNAPTIIEADKEYEPKVITRGNCMMCGKELTEGLFLCKECREKANKESEEK